MPQANVSFEIKDKALLAMLRESPKIFNQNVNRAFQRIGGGFMKDFAGSRLVRGIYQVRRKGATRRTGRGQPAIPKKARLAGFKAVITGRQSLQKKRLVIRTRNPALTIRESGGTIRPKRSGYLIIRGDPKGRGAARRKERSRARQIERFGRVRYDKIVLRKVRQVRVRAVLGFVSTWRGYLPRAHLIFRDALKGAVNRIAKRKAA